MTFADDHCEIRVSDRVAVVHDRERDRYFRTPVGALPMSVRSALRVTTRRIPAGVALGAVVLTVLTWTAVAASSASNAPPDGAGVAAFFAVLVPSLALHETAHVMTLRLFGRKPDRMGVKLNHGIFPAVYVRMSQTILLDRSEQAVVHLAGIASNVVSLAALLIINQVWIGSAPLTFAVHVTTLLLGWNLVPVLGSDGFRVVLALGRIDAARGFRHNPLWLNVLRVASMATAVFVVLHLALTSWK